MYRTPLLTLAAIFLLQGSINITPGKASIQLGESTTLKWTTQGESAYLTGIGVVPSSGSVVVTPSESTEFTLVSEGPKGIQYASTTVRITGERGSTIFPDPDDFPSGFKGERKSIRYTVFLDLAYSNFQNKLKVKVRSEHAPRSASYFLFTERQLRPDLVKSSDQGIRYRRVAYAVRIDEPQANAKNVSFEVKAIVEYQRLAESSWHSETDPKVANVVLAELKTNLEAGTTKAP